jgi:hypothetical protein
MMFAGFAAMTALVGGAQSGCVMSAIMPSVIEAPQIQARAVQFSGAAGGNGSGGATMRVELVGYNPNAFALYAASLRADLVVSGRSVGTVDATFTQVLPARRPLVVLVEVNVSRSTAVRVAPTNAPATATNAGAPVVMGDAMTVDAAPFRVDGTLVFRSRYGDVNVPWGFQGAVQSNVFAGW